MKKFFGWFVKPPVLSCIGVIFLALVIWFGGPQLGFGESHPMEPEGVRWVMIWFFFGLWAAYWLWKMIAAKMANAALMKSVAGADAPPPDPNAEKSATEVATLNKAMQEAMATLKNSKVGGKANGQYMYQLPWYMFVGAPGTGKTTALAESGLQFPAGKKAIGGVGGTRNCDWWFTDEAVLLDTAGRYTTQDSHGEVDKAAWNGFLDLLKKHRRRRPINGVIIAVSASDLMRMNESERSAQAASIRSRIKELHERLEIRFPIYVLVTKCDLLAGFIEYFDNLGKEERNQVWGVTFPTLETDKIDETLQSLPGELLALEHQLQVRVLERVQQERDIKRRALIYSFPQQFTVLTDGVTRFLNEVFSSNKYEENALLRGVYFSSGTQEGSPIDRVMGALAASFGLDRQVLSPNANSGRSYFIHRLLKEVVFKEAELVGTNLRFEKQRRLLQWGSAAALGLFFVVAGVLLTVSYVKNKNYIADMETQVAAVDKMAKDLPAQHRAGDLLPLLNAARDLPGGYSDTANKKGTPLMERWGLSQRAKLGEGAQMMYRKLLRDSMAPDMMSFLQETLRRGGSDNPDALYYALRVYLMMGGEHFDKDDILVWSDLLWTRKMGLNEDQRQVMLLHLDAMLEHQNEAPLALDKVLVDQTRFALAQMPLEKRVYNNVKRGLTQAKLAEFSVNAVGGPQAPLVLVRKSGAPLTRGVPGMFSVAGFKKFQELNLQAVADMAKDSWVLAQQEKITDPVKIDQIKTAVANLYYEEYIKQWDEFLADVGIVSFTSLDHGAQVVTILSGAESPLKKFLTAAGKETRLEGTAKLPGEATGKALKETLNAAKSRLGNVLGAVTDDAVNAGSTVKVTNPVDMHFAGLQKLVGMPEPGAPAPAAGAAGAAAPLDATLEAMKGVAKFMTDANLAKQNGTPAPSPEVLAQFKLQGAGKPELANVLGAIDSGTTGLTKGNERERLSALWSPIGDFCRKAVAGRYPMVRSAAQEATPDDFGRLFSPGGMMDDFFQKNLAQIVDTSGSWHLRPGNASVGINPGVLAQFQRAARIRDALFGNGGKQAGVRFDLKTVNIDPAFSKFALEIDGQTLSYTAGTPARMSFTLPSGKGTGTVRFDTTPASSLRTDGPWAWFRMMDKGTLEATKQGELYKLTFNLDGKKAEFEMQASSVINPFKRDMLEQFQCPGSF